jgi:hypothetical protein
MKKDSTGSSCTSAPAGTDSLKHRQRVSSFPAFPRQTGQGVVHMERQVGHRSAQCKVKAEDQGQHNDQRRHRKASIALIEGSVDGVFHAGQVSKRWLG